MTNNPVTAALVGAALALLPPVWLHSRHVVTLVHEAGHAMIALLTGRRLNAVRLHSDTSGLTISSGRPHGPGMVAMAAAGYLAPSVLGLVCIWLVAAGLTPWALWAALLTLALMLLYIRNWFGLVVVGLAGGAVAVLIWRTSAEVQDLAASILAWFLLVAGPRTTLDLWSHRRRQRTRTTDADLLARLTHVPAAVWNTFLLLATLSALGFAVVLLRGA
ncbi:MAG: M50 family metallopeptidase [Aeromicrobium sp.]